MPKHSRGRSRRQVLRLSASASFVVLFALLAVAGVTGYHPWHRGSTSATVANTSAEADSTRAAATHAPSSPSASGSTTTAGSAQPVDAASPRHRHAKHQKILRAGHPIAKLPEPVDSHFRMATYNVEGSQHAANGAGRVRTAAGLITDRGIDLVGLQEVQDDQRAALSSALPGYSVWPGDSLGNQGYRHQILYRDSKFELVDGGSVPYVFDSQTVPLPYALMRDRESGGEFYLIDAHNSPLGLEGQRDSATGVEASLINRLKQTGLPVLITIDANEHTEWFCRIAGDTGLVSANGGYWSGGCHLPPGQLRIDWIMGGGTGDSAVDFSDYVQDITPQHLHISDHYLIYADVQVTSPPPETHAPARGSGNR